MPKYNNRTCYYNGVKFDSVRERNRYCELLLMEKSGIISNLKRQVKFELIPAQRVDGKVVERKCEYIADFVYEENGKTVVEDSKGHKTKDYIIKRKLMLEKYGVKVRET